MLGGSRAGLGLERVAGLDREGELHTDADMVARLEGLGFMEGGKLVPRGSHVWLVRKR